MGRIIIAGAGIGGMVAAKKLAELGYIVDVYEAASKLEEMRFDWHDDLTPKAFDEAGYVMPKENYLKNDCTFVAPFDKAYKTVITNAENRDHSVERRPLNKMLYDEAVKVGANFHFGVIVEKAIVENEKVVGIVAGGSEERGDLVVDSLGLNSVVRESLPTSFKIQNKIGDNEKFMAYRAFYACREERATDAYDIAVANKIYMKHLGEEGISWCLYDHNPQNMNVLIGRVGKLSKETLDKALADLREKNTILSDKLTRGGLTCQIPIRYPLSRMVADGYVAIGDAAFMTIPMLGSGIASSMVAGKILGDTIAKNKKFDKASLWDYQYGIYKRFGIMHCGVDALKRFLLTLDNDILAWILGGGLLREKDLESTASGALIKISVKDYPQKIKAAKGHFIDLLKLKAGLDNAFKCQKVASKISKNFNEKKIAKWQEKLDSLYK